jgi:Na+/H+ antiporter NhaD/arsenite permease-like protein
VNATVVAIFAAVYLGMFLGGLPFLQVDRTGVALLGAIAIVGLGVLSPEQAARSVHLPTLLLLFSFMVISAQMRLGGFYGWVTSGIAALPLPPAALLGALIGAVALLSAVFSNDIVCLAAAPLLIEACAKRRLDPVPFLLALACAANVGSAATLIGNPQNMLIGQKLGLPFARYSLGALVPVLAGLALTWSLVAWQTRARWHAAEPLPGPRDPTVPFDRWQSAKGLAVVSALVAVFVFTSWPRDVAALVGAGLLLTSRKLHSDRMLGLVDWELLILFVGLFVVNHALEQTGVAAHGLDSLAAAGVPLDRPAPLFAATVVLSNLVSNVPAVMLLLPAAKGSFAGPLLALASTLAGNLLIVGSIANIIVIDAARRRGIVIGWRRHARTGMPVALATLAVAALWLGAGL